MVGWMEKEERVQKEQGEVARWGEERVLNTTTTETVECFSVSE